MQSKVKLSNRENEVLVLISNGLDNQSIAESLNIKINTVKSYIEKLHIKIGSKNRVQLALFCINEKNRGTDEFPVNTKNY